VSSKQLPTDLSLQTPLFGSERVVQRILENGTVVRATLEPAGPDQVRIIEYHRRDRSGRWQRRPEEEQRVVPFGTLGLNGSYSDIFGETSQAT
jgi:hypothetical protein